jgi:hypothetical protein
MDLERFWGVFADVDTPGDLHDRLEALDQPALVAFERRHALLHADAYDWGLWGAAYVIHGGCSDDTFSDFRSYLGRSVFENSLENPDSMADVDGLDDEAEEWEDWSSPTMAVMHRRTGEYDFAGPPDPDRAAPGEPTGEAWNEDADELGRRFPRLTAKYC